MKKLSLRKKGIKLGVSRETVRLWEKNGKPKQVTATCPVCKKRFKTRDYPNIKGYFKKYCSLTCGNRARAERHYYDGKVLTVFGKKFKLVEIK